MTRGTDSSDAAVEWLESFYDSWVFKDWAIGYASLYGEPMRYFRYRPEEPFPHGYRISGPMFMLKDDQDRTQTMRWWHGEEQDAEGE